jgi:hypothetical protein
MSYPESIVIHWIVLDIWISCQNQWILEVWLDSMEHLKWLFIDAWSLLLLEVIMAWKGGGISGKGIRKYG